MTAPLPIPPLDQDEIPTDVHHELPPPDSSPALPFSPEAPITSLPGFEQREDAAQPAQSPAFDLDTAPSAAEAPARPGAFALAAPEIRAMGDPSVPLDRPALPLLVDVTPLSLCVETVSGFCDTIIARNTPIPCAQSRAFVTAVDNQTIVHVRVGQGESTTFGKNTVLGQLELSGLSPLPRGQAEVVVTFSLDTDGILNVIAADSASGRETTARLRLVGVTDADVDSLSRRHAARAQ
jgi:hypothetical protein